ncbi:MAG: SIR2 family protein [Phycisphaerales bacterium JB050]
MAQDGELLSRLAQKCVNAPPVLVIGSGLSAGCGIRGMAELASDLEKLVKPSESDLECWKQVTSSMRSAGLERALAEANATSEPLVQQIARHTRDMICNDDLDIFLKLIERKQTLPLSRLFTHIFNSTNRLSCVVTTNYDRLIEYSADAAGFRHHTGFRHGYIRRKCGALSHNAKLNSQLVSIAKVHGSIDWFRSPDGIVTSIPLQLEYPHSLQPAIVTPGSSKYELAHDEPFRSAMHAADDYLSNASAFFCVGYGFNDKHIQLKLIERIRDKSCPIVIISREFTQNARKFISNECKSDFLCIERAGNGSNIYTAENPDGFQIDNSDLWNLDSFLDAFIL